MCASVELAISGNLTIMFPSMTVLIAYMDVDSGEASLIADGRASKEETCAFPDEWKTARLNADIAIGFAGDVAWGNQLLARLFKRKDLQAKGPNIRIVRVLEAEHAERLGLDWESAKREITNELVALRRIESLPDLTVMMAGVDNGAPKVAVWHQDYAWEAAEMSPKAGMSIAKVSIGPEGENLDTSILENTSLTLEERARQAVLAYAREFPDSVNDYTTIRRASGGFRLEILSTEPSYNQYRGSERGCNL